MNSGVHMVNLSVAQILAHECLPDFISMGYEDAKVKVIWVELVVQLESRVCKFCEVTFLQC